MAEAGDASVSGGDGGVDKVSFIVSFVVVYEFAGSICVYVVSLVSMDVP